MLTADAMVKSAREQKDAFNNDDWERLQAGLAADARYDEFGTQRKAEGLRVKHSYWEGFMERLGSAQGSVGGSTFPVPSQRGHVRSPAPTRPSGPGGMGPSGKYARSFPVPLQPGQSSCPGSALLLTLAGL